jgi:hypothetical protein
MRRKIERAFKQLKSLFRYNQIPSKLDAPAALRGIAACDVLWSGSGERLFFLFIECYIDCFFLLCILMFFFIVAQPRR